MLNQEIYRKNLIPYTLSLRSYRRLGKEYSITFFKETFEKKNSRLNFAFTKAKLHNAEHYEIFMLS